MEWESTFEADLPEVFFRVMKEVFLVVFFAQALEANNDAIKAFAVRLA